MPLFVPFIRNSTFSSKSLTVPPRQIRKLFSFMTFSGVVSPTISPFSTRQNVRVAIPAVQRLAVEDRHEARRVVRLSLWIYTPAGPYLRGRRLLAGADRRRRVRQRREGGTQR